jgi:hypothetical protein
MVTLTELLYTVVQQEMYNKNVQQEMYNKKCLQFRKLCNKMGCARYRRSHCTKVQPQIRKEIYYLMFQ